MKRLFVPLVVIALAAIAIDADLNSYAKVYPSEFPIVNVPTKLRQRNWIRGAPNNGSCLWASTISLLRWQEQYALADRIRLTRGGGEQPSQFSKRLYAANMRHVAHAKGNAAFLEWSCLTRHGAVVVIKNGEHAVTLVDLTAEAAYLLDNNYPEKFREISRDKFLREWREAGGWAFVPLYNPASPLP